MTLNCGIVGLPNVGKSTIFSALTAVSADIANYPFCTIDPNVGVVNVPDPRLAQIAAIIPPERIVPAVVEFVDIAGLVRGASKGEGRGNQFLANIRNTGVIIHVVRCFENDDIVHVEGKVNPASDIETINIELALADLETVEKRLSKLDREIRSNDREVAKRAIQLQPLLEQAQKLLADGRPARLLDFTPEQEKLISDLHLITRKKQLYVCNVDERSISTESPLVAEVQTVAAAEGAGVVAICGQLEAEISRLDTDAEKQAFLEEAGLAESGLSRLIHESYRLLGLRTYFTAGPKEVRAWTIVAGDKAPQAAGVIHSDFERGFIRAETYHCEDLFSAGSEQKVREAGKLRQEGKEYVVQDGDIMHFKFNV
ncbi:MAG TPA: redox-regulated ATPase YchF [Spirochaetia bacterium]|nr:redox-regulated ATPase YchF [Spirochaetia bacterium]